MSDANEDVQSLLVGYRDTLQFILQFLHSEGFEASETVLLQEIEQRLPAIIEEKLSGDHESPSKVSQSAGSEPDIFEKLQSSLSSGSFGGNSRAKSAGASAVSGHENSEHRQGVSTEASIRRPSEHHHSESHDSGCLEPQMVAELGNERHKSQRAAARKMHRMLSIPSPVMDGGDPSINEYSDDDDPGYVRIDVQDHHAFQQLEIELSDGGETPASGATRSDDGGSSADGSEYRSQSRDRQDHSSSRGSSGFSSRHSSYFSGEISDDRSPALSNLASECAEGDVMFGFQSLPLPPADTDEEVFVMGLDGAFVEASEQNGNLEDATALHGTGFIAEEAQIDLNVAPQKQHDAQGSQGAGWDKTGVSDTYDEMTELTGSGEVDGDRGGDFEFPVTPTAQDPSAVFSTWTHIRSHSMSNASDFCLEGFSPSQQSPEKDTTRRRHADDISSPGVNPDVSKALDHRVESLQRLQLNDKAASDSEIDSPVRDTIKSPIREPSLSQQEAEPVLQSLWQGESSSAEQVISMLEELENAQSVDSDTPKEYHGSLAGPGIQSSNTDPVQLWTEDEEHAEAERIESAASQIAFDEEHVTGAEFESVDPGDSEKQSVAEQVEEQPQEAKAEDVEVMQYDLAQLEAKYEVFNLQIIHRRRHTGFEETKDFPIRLNDCVAGRYQILDYLGSAAFSRAVQALDLKTGMLVCLKIIKNNKDYFDQSLDEIKLLKFVNQSDPLDTKGILQMYDYFYYKEHLFIVCELLRANLYEFQKYNRESGDEPYFTLPRLQAISRQVLRSLAFLHKLDLIHSDLKPENILIKSYSRCEVKVIDLGSSCFTTDHLSNYVQSRSYRAPEVILGHSYDQRIDIWSLGCILAELSSGYVLFQNDSLATLLARLIGILGPIPKQMLRTGRYVHRFFTRSGHLYERSQTGHYQLLRPKVTSLAARVPDADEGFLSFLKYLLTIDPAERPTAKQALDHPWLQHPYPSFLDPPSQRISVR